MIYRVSTFLKTDVMSSPKAVLSLVCVCGFLNFFLFACQDMVQSVSESLTGTTWRRQPPPGWLGLDNNNNNNISASFDARRRH